MTEQEFEIALLEGARDDAKHAATRLANALQDIYNDVGQLREVRTRFNEVELDVAHYKGLVPNGKGEQPAANELNEG